MSDNQHTVYFEGDIADGFSIGQVKKNLAKLFKSDANRIGQLFSGERVALKKNLDLATAKKYHSVLFTAGALVTIAAANGAPLAANDAQQQAQEEQEQQPEFSWSLAPIGSLLLRATEKVKQAVVNIDISHLSLASVFATEKTKAAVEMPALDTSHLSVAPVGEQLVASRAEETELTLDLSALSIDPPGTQLGSSASNTAEELQLDLSQYALLEPGEETIVTRPAQSPTPAPPDVSHLELLPEPEPEAENAPS